MRLKHFVNIFDFFYYTTSQIPPIQFYSVGSVDALVFKNSCILVFLS